jgi:hypothetical protein
MAAIPSVKLNGCDCKLYANFKTETDKIRAVFYWTASNISYDVPGMFDLNVNETVPEKIAKALKGEKEFVLIMLSFLMILLKSGNSVLYYRRVHQTVRKVSSLAHAWTAAKINNKWYVFDPTWGAGYVNNGKFFKKLNNSYFKVAPSVSIASHMPFDYLWQFSNYPISNNDFYEGKIQMNKTKKYFDFEKKSIFISHFQKKISYSHQLKE